MDTTNQSMELLTLQKEFYKSGATQSLKFRRNQLKQLQKMIVENEPQILEAVYRDIQKPRFENLLTETQIVLWEIDHVLANLSEWMEPEKVVTPPFHLPAKSRIVPEPLGNALIIAPWNYPFQLLVAPLVASIAAGNTAVLKPSEVSENTAKMIASLIPMYFEREYVAVVEGGVEETTRLLNQVWDVIFYTGNTLVGKIVMKAAAAHLTPVILELGGKSPCIVDKHTNIKQTARKIAWGKFINAGQTCIAPDYVLVHHEVKPQLEKAIAEVIREFYGDDPQQSKDFARIINSRHFERLKRCLNDEKIIYGGICDDADAYISPTLVDYPSETSAIMSEEIFGPLLPIIPFHTVEEAIGFVNRRPKPLALYLFSKKSPFVDFVIANTSSGGVCVNDTLSHITTSYLPFGGVGASGMGQYHGKKGFESFSHYKSVMYKSQLFDLPLRYPPYIKLNKGLLKIFKWIN